MTTLHRRRLLTAGAGLAVFPSLLATGCSPSSETSEEFAPSASSGTTTRAATAVPASPLAGGTAGPARPVGGATAVSRSPRRLPGQPEQIEHGPRSRPRVALTFDGDGEPRTARAMLRTLAEHRVHATVLAVGTWLGADPGLARAILDGGHELGNHTEHHRDINALPEAEARAEIEDCARRLRRLTGGIGAWFRPSRAHDANTVVRALARKAGYPHVLSYDIAPLDYRDPGSAAVTRRVLDAARPGGIITLNMGRAGTLEALPDILDGLGRRGLDVGTASALLV
ncbi:polysaccharide deacetylase family protein [Streptomyces sp. NPDC007088]|uniref:polysaccharide deacetylase family protein n=1 Tax=Streptomyces sp. NPDC007088 TaxID=3364773 RepID=UPI0036D0D66E